MKIETLKDFEAVLKICRKHGVTNVTVDGITLSLEVAEKPAPAATTEQPKTEDEFQELDVAFWSAGGAN